MEALFALLMAALALMGSPGPATLSSAAIGAAFGTRAALPYVLGISLGTSTVILMVATGLTGLISLIDGAATIATVLAGLYIAYLAIKIATAPPLGALDRSRKSPPLIAGYALAIANPKAYAAMAALFSGFLIFPSAPVENAMAKLAILASLAFLINITWMYLGASLAGAMQRPALSRAINIAFAVLLVLSIAVPVLI